MAHQSGKLPGKNRTAQPKRVPSSRSQHRAEQALENAKVARLPLLLAQHKNQSSKKRRQPFTTRKPQQKRVRGANNCGAALGFLRSTESRPQLAVRHAAQQVFGAGEIPAPHQAFQQGVVSLGLQPGTWAMFGFQVLPRYVYVCTYIHHMCMY